MPAGALIDLGEDRSPGVRSPRAWSRRWRLRRAAAVLVGCAVLLTGLPAPAASGFAAIATIVAPETSAVLLTGPDLYVAESPAGRHRLTDHVLPGGAVRWRVLLPNPVRAVQWIADTRVVLATVYGGDPQTDGIFAFDSDSGRRLWSQPGAVALDTPAGGRLLLQRETMAGEVDLRWVDDRTGRVVWLLPIAPDAALATAHDPARPGPGGLLITDSGGGGRLLAEATGAVLVRGELRDAGTPLWVLGAQILGQHRRIGVTGSLVAVEVAALTPRWSVSNGTLGSPFICAALVCLGAAEGLHAVDPATGGVRWRMSHWQYASMLGAHSLLAYSAGPDRGELAVLDARTGRALRDLRADWTWVILDGARAPVLGRADARHPDQYWFSRLDVEPVAVLPIGVLAGIDPASCQLAGDTFACRSRRGELRVWRSRG
jgi:outer membrane protein assembly factor BamB